MEEWGCEGVIARVVNDRVARQIAALGLPAVVLAYTAGPGQIRLGTGSPGSEGAMAAEHFLDRGFQNFAFCGYSEAVYAGRQQVFQGASLRPDGRSMSTGVHESGRRAGGAFSSNIWCNG